MRHSTPTRLLLFLAASLLTVACSSENPQASKQNIPPFASTASGGGGGSFSASGSGGGGGGGAAASGPAAQAKEVFALRCTPCHGPDGRGDGAASASLTPKPRNFHDAAWQAGASDDHIAKIIQYGGTAVGKSAAMPANPDLTEKPEVVSALKDHIRGMGRP